MPQPMKQRTFMVRLLNTQHETWQGTITWLDSNRTQPFRSLLEMIKLMDSVSVTAEDKDSGV